MSYDLRKSVCALCKTT